MPNYEDVSPLASFKLPNGAKTGNLLSLSDTGGICNATSAMTRDALDPSILANDMYGSGIAPYTSLKAKSPVGNFPITHYVTRFKEGTDHFLIDDPQHNFIGTRPDVGDWEPYYDDRLNMAGPFKKYGPIMEEPSALFQPKYYNELMDSELKTPIQNLRQDGDYMVGELNGMDVRHHPEEEMTWFKQKGNLPFWKKETFDPRVFRDTPKTRDAFQAGVNPEALAAILKGNRVKLLSAAGPLAMFGAVAAGQDPAEAATGLETQQAGAPGLPIQDVNNVQWDGSGRLSGTQAGYRAPQRPVTQDRAQWEQYYQQGGR